MGADAASALAASTDVDINTTTSTAGKKFTVSVGTSYNLALTPLMGMLGYQTMNIATKTTESILICWKKMDGIWMIRNMVLMVGVN